MKKKGCHNRNGVLVTHGNAKLCHDRTCVQKAVKGSPHCERHQADPAAPIDPAKLKRMTARR
jgi:hypothetical protein